MSAQPSAPASEYDWLASTATDPVSVLGYRAGFGHDGCDCNADHIMVCIIDCFMQSHLYFKDSMNVLTIDCNDPGA